VILPVTRAHFREEEIIVAENETAEQTDRNLSDQVSEDHPGASKLEMHPEAETGSKPVVLVVEDNGDLRSYISGNLNTDFQVLVADHGASGLRVAIEYVPDLIVTDLMMPEMSGMEMTEKLKTDERTSHIPVIMLTARADRHSKLEGLETGADDYLIKPFDTKELMIRVKNLIDQRTRLRENFRWQFLSGEHKDIPVSSKDQWVEKIFSLLKRRASEPDFNMKKMAKELGMSDRQLFRKVQALTGFTPNHLLRNIRLKKAAALFDRGMDNITEVMYEVGYTHHSYFAKCFRELYKINPSEYVKRMRRSSLK
jgi:DNA-binding response OmpR family regulator